MKKRVTTPSSSSRRAGRGGRSYVALFLVLTLVLVVIALLHMHMTLRAGQGSEKALDSPQQLQLLPQQQQQQQQRPPPPPSPPPPPPPLPSQPTRRRIAYAITITKDGFFQDGAAVLAYSIVKNSGDRDYDVSLVAFVHPEVVQSRPILSKIGFHVIEAPTPVNISAIKFKFLREKMNKNGCCGASELIKINSYRLTQYDKVIHMDADVAILGNIDEVINRNVSLVYTTDPNMATHKGEDHMPAQGGLLVLQPCLQDYRNIIDVVMTKEFMMGSGWNGSKIGWFWGGMTVQGVLPYYYNAGNIPGQSALTAYGRRVIVDRCIYNTMADSDECQKTEISKIKTAHFTVCQKPWTCYTSHVNALCAQLHKEWFQLRREAESYYGIAPVQDACLNRYKKRGYLPMDLENAKLPGNSILRPDDSPDLLEPTEESRFVTKDYEKTSGGKDRVKDTPEEAREKQQRKAKRLEWEAKQAAKKRSLG